MSWYRVLLLLMFVLSALSEDYQIPNIEFERSSGGYSIYIPDDPNIIKAVNYILQVNNKCPQFQNHLTEPINGKWTLKETVHNGDNVNVYLFVEIDSGILKKYSEIHVSNNGTTKFVKRAKTPKDSQSNKWCLPTETTFLGKKSKCAGQLLFEETFSDRTLDLKVWTHEIRSVVYTYGSEFVAYDNQTENCYIDDGKLTLKATWNKRNKPVNLGTRCTSRHPGTIKSQECNYTNTYQGNFPHPAAFSSKIHTRGKVYGKYFRMEIRALMPKGDFLFPYILLQPMSKYSEDANVNQMRIFSRGNIKLKSNCTKEHIGSRTLFGEILHWYHPPLFDRFEKSDRAQKNYGDIYHNYGINWQRNKVTFDIDGHDFGRIDTKPLKSFNEEDFYIVLGLTVGGIYNFPDIQGNFSEIIGRRGKKSVNKFRKSNNITTWKQPLIVDSIRLFATGLIDSDEISQ